MILGNKNQPGNVDRDLEKLAPFFKNRLLLALNEAHDHGLDIHLFEGYRSPERQAWLYEFGRTRDGSKVTNAKPWESFHQYSIASDLVFKRDGKWTWDGDYDQLKVIMERFGFEGLSWEKPHFQITGGLSHREAHRIARDQGMLALWNVVERAIKKPT